MAKIRFQPVSLVPEDRLDGHRRYSRGLGLPEIKPGTVGVAAPNLAVVGGSPGVVDFVDELRNWDGDVFAINSTWEWCRDNGIDAIFYTIDPLAVAPEGVGRAVLGDTVPPGVFDALIGAEIELVRLGLDEIVPASTSAATALMFALWRGHKHTTLFGCESSFTDTTHTHKNEAPNKVWVQCGGAEYVTSPQMIMQAEMIQEIVRALPKAVSVRGGGFLPALIEHGDYAVTHVSPELDRVLKGQAA